MAGGKRPSADGIAQAFNLAAEALGEREDLRADPERCIAGYKRLRARWPVFYALMCAGVPWHVAAPLCGVDKTVNIDDMRQFFGARWWTWELAQRLTTHFAEDLA